MMLDRVNELTIGQVFKNYSALCKYLNVTAKRGDNKALQIQEFNKYFTFERIGDEIVITSIGNDSKKLTRHDIIASRIELNKEYTYNDFCKLIGEKVEMQHDMKYLQRLNWSRYFELCATKYNVTVFEVYKQPIEVAKQLYVVIPKSECNNRTNADILKANIGRLQVGQTFDGFFELMQYLDLKMSNNTSELGMINTCLRYLDFKVNLRSNGRVSRFKSLTITEIRDKALSDEEVRQLCRERDAELTKIPLNYELELLMEKVGTAHVGLCAKSKASRNKDIKASDAVVDITAVNRLRLNA